jgi:sialate O-acetylesterase
MAALGCALPAVAGVKLPGFFSDHMVVQRDMAIPVWGWASAGEKVTVAFAGNNASATADKSGAWRVDLPKLGAGGPHEMVIKGQNTITLKDVLVGEVWLCSGQSNMQWTVNRSLNGRAEVAAANHPRIRQFKVPNRPSRSPESDIAAKWQVCSPGSAAIFTACGYFMARELQKELDVPIGLINSSWGGTRVEPWTAPEGFAQVPALKGIADKVAMQSPTNPRYQEALKAHFAATESWLVSAKAALAGEATGVPPLPTLPPGMAPAAGKINHQDPVMLYNSMIHPMIGLPFRGAIWYQGESNHVEGAMYTEKKKALIGGWRKLWGMGDFPFYFVQIAPYHYGKESPTILPVFWEAQEKVLEIPNTGMVVTSDIATVNDIHPPNKQDVGKRLALLALNRIYGKKTVDSGPRFKATKPEGKTLRVTFENTAGGLKSRDGKPLTWFEVAGVNTGYQTANAVIDGDSIVLSSDKVPEPLAMRFGWNKKAEPNLANGAGLPCGAFRAGEIPRPDFAAQIKDLKQGYKLACDLNLDNLGGHIAYDVDNRATITGQISRIAYLVELQGANTGTQFIYVSTDAFTQDLGKIAVPTAASGANFQQLIKNMTVESNVEGIVNGTNLDGGNMEFWSNNYAPQNVANVPGASGAVYDFGDSASGPPNGYGSMQIHNHKAKQTLFAINQWNSGGAGADIGIGNSKSQHKDWTFTKSGGSYESKRLRVYVK